MGSCQAATQRVAAFQLAGAIQKGLPRKLSERQARQRRLQELLRADDIHPRRRAALHNAGVAARWSNP